MKKTLLVGFALSFGCLATAQKSSIIPQSVTPQRINPLAKNLALHYEKNQMLGGNSFETMVNSLTATPSTPQLKNSRSYVPELIGTSSYQLQTNASVCNRIVKNSDGTISATWTMAQAADWSDRGTGYNYFDGSVWGAAPTVRIESERTGFTNIGVTNTGGEIVVAHEASSVPLPDYIHVASRPVKGTGAWAESNLGFSDVWARMSIGGLNGQTIHVISQTAGVSGLIWHGQNGAVSYSRSQDGGVTWDKLQTLIPEIDSSHYLGFGGDQYAIDAKGDTVVIALCGFDTDVLILKSIDNGNSWTKTIIDSFPIPLFDAVTMITDENGDSVADTIESNDAAISVLLDNAGMAHVWFGRMRVLCDAPGTGTGLGLSYFPYTDGLMYWNENMGATAPVMIAAVKDLNYPGHLADGVLNVDLDGAGTGLLGMGSYQVSLTSHPSAGIDAGGSIYLSYSGLFEGVNEQGDDPAGSTTNNPPHKSYRHVYLMRSNDNGVTWCPSVDITDPDMIDGVITGTYDYREEVYGSMAKDVDANVHLILQRDGSTGHGVSTATTPDPQTGNAEIYYVPVPVGDVACDIAVNNKPTFVNSFSVYPNPGSSDVYINFVNLTKTSKVSLKITNLLGQEVENIENVSFVKSSAVKINVSNFQRGVYFITALVDGKSTSQKLVVE